jgi:NAD(P)-dependent dehydrogenase (short-subunit alcohol dehydrogenase family)
MAVAVVTGSAAGLGRAFVAELRSRGYSVIEIDRDTCDVADRSQVERAAAGCPPVDLLINNAAVSISAPFEKTAPDDFERLIAVNFLGTVNTTRAFLPLLRGRPGAHIVNVSSCFAWHGYPNKTAYSAAKAAIRAFSESLRIELAPEGIGVTLVFPGILRTGIVKHGIGSDPGEHEFLQRRGLDAAVAARRTLDRLAAHPARIVIGRDYRAYDLLARCFPGRFGKLLAIIRTAAAP